MHTLDLLTPWLTFAVILWPLLYLERWIHQHLYGVGWLLTQDRERATILYYFIFLPGVFLHEFTQWLMAGALNVKTSKIRVWPRVQKNGTLRYDFVKIRKATRLRATIIGLAPLLAGISIVLFISLSILDVRSISEAAASGDLVVVWSEIRRLLSTPDFWLWLYLLFAIGNAMMPTPEDRQDWPLLAGIFVVISVFLLTIGLGEEVLLPTLQGPISRVLGILVTAFGTVFVLDCFIVVILTVLERALQRITGKQASYPKPAKSRPIKPEPGGESPLPPDMAPEAIADRRLPIPPPPNQTPESRTLPEPSPARPQAQATQTEMRFGRREHGQVTSANAPPDEDTDEETDTVGAPNDFDDTREPTEDEEPGDEEVLDDEEDDTDEDELSYEDIEDNP